MRSRAPKAKAGKLDGLYAQIVASPDDAQLRQVYADALIEAGDPRGEFIQLQTQAEALPAGDAARTKLEKLAAKLEKAHRRKWLDALPMIRQGTFRSGLLHSVVATADDFFKGADTLFARAPVRGVKLTKLKASHLAPLAALLEKRALEAIDLSASTLVSRHVAELFAKADTSRLKDLRLIDDPIELQGYAMIASRPLEHLEQLHLGGSLCGAPGDDALAVFLASPGLRKLRGLSLSYFGITTAGAKRLAASPMLANVERLNLQSNRIEDAGIAALAESPHLRTLRELNLGHSGIGDAGVKALLDSKILDGFKSGKWPLILWDRNKRVSAESKKLVEKKLGPNMIGW